MAAGSASRVWPTGQTTSNSSATTRTASSPRQRELRCDVHGVAPRTNRARSMRSISNVLTHLTPTPIHTLGILIFFREADRPSSVTTVWYAPVRSSSSPHLGGTAGRRSARSHALPPIRRPLREPASQMAWAGRRTRGPVVPPTRRDRRCRTSTRRPPSRCSIPRRRHAVQPANFQNAGQKSKPSYWSLAVMNTLLSRR